MTLRIISGILIIVTAYLGVKHGWAGISNRVKPEEAELFNGIGLTRTMGIVISILSLAGGLMVLFPQTFFAGNLLNALMIVVIMAMAARSGVTRVVLMEIPFLVMPLVLIYIGHPFKK